MKSPSGSLVGFYLSMLPKTIAITVQTRIQKTFFVASLSTIYCSVVKNNNIAYQPAICAHIPFTMKIAKNIAFQKP